MNGTISNNCLYDVLSKFTYECRGSYKKEGREDPMSLICFGVWSKKVLVGATVDNTQHPQSSKTRFVPLVRAFAFV